MTRGPVVLRIVALAVHAVAPVVTVHSRCPSRAPWFQWPAVGADVNGVYVRRRAPWGVRGHSVFFGKGFARRHSNAAMPISVDALSNRRAVAIFPHSVALANFDISEPCVDGCVHRVALNIKWLAPPLVLKCPKPSGRPSSYASTRWRACSSG